MVVYELDAFEELFVEGDVVGMLGENRAQFLSQCFHLVAGFCAHHAGENVRHSAEEVVIMFALVGVHTSHSILEGRLCWVVDDLVGRLVVTTDSFHEGFLVVRELDTVEWHRVMRCVIRFEKWIYSILDVLFVKHTNLY